MASFRSESAIKIRAGLKKFKLLNVMLGEGNSPYIRHIRHKVRLYYTINFNLSQPFRKQNAKPVREDGLLRMMIGQWTEDRERKNSLSLFFYS